MTTRIVDGCQELGAIRELFNEYAGSLDFDLGFQNYGDEFSSLPGKYSPPWGRLLLALHEKQPAGCVALRRYGESRCEMKRLYVKPEFRGLGIGGLLVAEVLAGAREIGYAEMILDTLAGFERSVALYRKIGFREIAPYYHNPHPDVLYMALAL